MARDEVEKVKIRSCRTSSAMIRSLNFILKALGSHQRNLSKGVHFFNGLPRLLCGEKLENARPKAQDWIEGCCNSPRDDMRAGLGFSGGVKEKIWNVLFQRTDMMI